jgi:hydroxyacylglutathione hydrolase
MPATIKFPQITPLFSALLCFRDHHHTPAHSFFLVIFQSPGYTGFYMRTYSTRSRRVSSTQIHRIKLGVCNCYLIKEKSAILVDAGPPKQEYKFIRKILSLGTEPEEVSLIVVTHGHIDHIGSLLGIKTVTGAEVLAHQREKDILEQAIWTLPGAVTSWGAFLLWLLKLAQKNIRFEPTPVDVEIMDSGFSLEGHGIKGRIVATPGHTKGSITLLLDSGEAFVGDLLMNGFPMRRGPGTPIFADDLKAVERSVQLLLEQGAKIFYPGHGEPFSAVFSQIE